MVVGKRCGGGIKPFLADGRVLGGDPLAAQYSLVRPPDAVADLEPLATRANAFDRTCQVAADDVRKSQRERHKPRANVKIDRVERNRVNLYEHLVRPRLGRGQLSDLDVLEWARLFDVRGFHGKPFSL